MRKINLSTLTNTYLMIPLWCLMDRSPNCKVIIAGCKSLSPSFLKMVYGMKLKLAHRLDKAFSITKLPIMQGVVKLPRSLFFAGSLFWRIIEHPLHNVTMDTSSNFRLFVNKSLGNLAYLDIYTNAFTNGTLIWHCLSKSKNQLNWSTPWSS